MNFRLTLITSVSVLALAGCASHLKKPGETHDLITQELKTAAESRSKAAEMALQNALLPPAQSMIEAKALEHRFDLSVNNAPAKDVFLALVAGSNYSMILSPDVGGSITVSLKNVTVF